MCRYFYLLFLTNAINEKFLDNYFPKDFKNAEIIPVYEKDNPLKKEPLLAYCSRCQRFSKDWFIRE